MSREAFPMPSDEQVSEEMVQDIQGTIVLFRRIYANDQMIMKQVLKRLYDELVNDVKQDSRLHHTVPMRAFSGDPLYPKITSMRAMNTNDLDSLAECVLLKNRIVA